MKELIFRGWVGGSRGETPSKGMRVSLSQSVRLGNERQSVRVGR